MIKISKIDKRSKGKASALQGQDNVISEIKVMFVNKVKIKSWLFTQQRFYNIQSVSTNTAQLTLGSHVADNQTSQCEYKWFYSLY